MPVVRQSPGTSDAFGRQRVSNPTTLFDSQQQYDTSPLLWDSTTSGSGTVTHSANGAAALCNVTTTSGDAVVRQTRAYHRYQPGKSHFVLTTFVMAAPEANLRQRVGYFDADNGVYLEQTGTTINVVLRSKVTGSVVNTAVPQASWNIDKYYDLDLEKAQIFYVALEWLGVGSVQVGFVVDGQLVPVHQFNNANNISNVYMTTANLPVRYEINATGTLSGGKSLQAICSSVISEGGFEDERGYPFSAANGVTSIGVTTRRPILSIRPKATFNSIVNRGAVIPQSTSVYADAAAFVEVVYGGTLTGASFSSVDASSITERDVSATAISGGIVLDSFYVAASNQTRGASSSNLSGRVPLTLDIAGSNPIPITIVVTSFSGTANSSGSISWREFR